MSKGSWRRPTLVSEESAREAWCRTFGHRWHDTHDRCAICGVTCAEVIEAHDRAQGDRPTRAAPRPERP